MAGILIHLILVSQLGVSGSSLVGLGIALLRVRAGQPTTPAGA